MRSRPKPFLRDAADKLRMHLVAVVASMIVDVPVVLAMALIVGSSVTTLQNALDAQESRGP